MNPPSLLAICCSVTLLLTSCGEPEKTPQQIRSDADAALNEAAKAAETLYGMGKVAQAEELLENAAQAHQQAYDAARAAEGSQEPAVARDVADPPFTDAAFAQRERPSPSTSATGSNRPEVLLIANTNNLKQLLTAMIGHRNDYGGTWPGPYVATEDPDGTKTLALFERICPDKTPAQMQLWTAIVFECLAYRLDMAPKSFVAAGAQTQLARPREIADIIAQPNPDYAQAYTLDWTTPSSAGSMRPVLTMRTFFDIDGVTKVPVVFADGHTEILTVTYDIENVMDPLTTTALPTSTLSAGIPQVGVDGTGDNIFRLETDNDDRPMQWDKYPFRGSRKYAFMR